MPAIKPETEVTIKNEGWKESNFITSGPEWDPEATEANGDGLVLLTIYNINYKTISVQISQKQF